MLAYRMARLARQGERLRYAAPAGLPHINNFLRMMTHVLNLRQHAIPNYGGYRDNQEMGQFHEGAEGQQRQATLQDFVQSGDYGSLMAYLDQMTEAGAGQGTRSQQQHYPASSLLSLLHQLAGHAGAALGDPAHPMLHPQVGALHPLIASYRDGEGGGEYMGDVLQGLQQLAGIGPHILQDLAARGLLQQTDTQRLPALAGRLATGVNRAHSRVLGGSLAHMGPLLAMLQHARETLGSVDPSYGIARQHGLDMDEPHTAADEAHTGLQQHLLQAVVPHLTGGHPIG